METPYSKSIVNREIVLGKRPSKSYTHSSATYAFSGPLEIREDLLKTMNIIKHPNFSINDYTFFVNMAWNAGNNEKPVKAFDIFGYRFDKPWEVCNPEVDLYNIEGEPLSNACETGLIILGAEGRLRRNTKNLNDFLRKWPGIENLGLKPKSV